MKQPEAAGSPRAGRGRGQTQREAAKLFQMRSGTSRDRSHVSESCSDSSSVLCEPHVPPFWGTPHNLPQPLVSAAIHGVQTHYKELIYFPPQR